MLMSTGMLEEGGARNVKEARGVKHLLLVDKRCIINKIGAQRKGKLTIMINTSLKSKGR